MTCAGPRHARASHSSTRSSPSSSSPFLSRSPRPLSARTRSQELVGTGRIRVWDHDPAPADAQTCLPRAIPTCSVFSCGMQHVFAQRASVPSSGIRPPRFYLISRVATLPLLALPSSTLRRTCIAAERNYASPPPHCPRLARRRAHGAARRRRQRFGHVWAVRGCPRSLFGHARGCEYSMHMHMRVCVCVCVSIARSSSRDAVPLSARFACLSACLAPPWACADRAGVRSASAACESRRRVGCSA